MNALRLCLLAAPVLILSAVPAFSCEHEKADAHAGHVAHGDSKEGGLYDSAMKAMHERMSVAPTGDADVDFVQGMIPHHQGAVDMAKIVLEHGKDPEIKKLAQDVVAAQEREISFMNGWLKKHGK